MWLITVISQNEYQHTLIKVTTSFNMLIMRYK